MAELLDGYRRKATFDVVAFQTLIDGEEVVEFRDQIWDTFAKDPLFASPTEEPSTDEEHHLSFQRLRRLVEYAFTDRESPTKQLGFLHAVYAYSLSLPMLYGLNRAVSLMMWVELVS